MALELNDEGYYSFQVWKRVLKSPASIKKYPTLWRFKFKPQPVINIKKNSLIPFIGTHDRVGRFVADKYGAGYWYFFGGTKAKNMYRRKWVVLFHVEVREDRHETLSWIVKPVSFRVARCWWWKD